MEPGGQISENKARRHHWQDGDSSIYLCHKMWLNTNDLWRPSWFFSSIADKPCSNKLIWQKDNNMMTMEGKHFVHWCLEVCKPVSLLSAEKGVHFEVLMSITSFLSHVSFHSLRAQLDLNIWYLVLHIWSKGESSFWLCFYFTPYHKII